MTQEIRELRALIAQLERQYDRLLDLATDRMLRAEAARERLAALERAQ